MATEPFTCRWGILATGGIAETFARDLLAPPALRNVTDVHHTIVAAASSTSTARAASFLRAVGAAATATPYASYAALLRDPAVDIVYVATPHSHHFQNAMLCLRHGKPVLCEKPLAVSAAQARALVAEAHARNLFLMEAVWSRFLPPVVELRDLLAAGAIGTVLRVVADCSEPRGVEVPPDHRLLNPALAGGALLDIGVYALTWCFLALYDAAGGTETEPPRVAGAAVCKYPGTGVDEQATVLLDFARQGAHAVATTSLRVGPGDAAAGVSVRIYGTAGEVELRGPAWAPGEYRVARRDGPAPAGWVRRQWRPPTTADGWGRGLFYEADEAARCVRDGRRESARMPLAETVAVMEVMDRARELGGLRYPPLVEADVYDEQGPFNTGADR